MNLIPVCTLYIYVLWTQSLCVHGYTVYLCYMNHIPLCTWIYCISMFYEPHPCVHMDILYIYVLWTTSLFAHGYNVYPQHSHVSSGYRECHQPEGVPVARWDQRFQQHSQQKLCRGTSEQASDQSPIHQVTTARLLRGDRLDATACITDGHLWRHNDSKALNTMGKKTSNKTLCGLRFSQPATGT
jgi:hypothetical protein